jgi:hypothetical protein
LLFIFISFIQSRKNIHKKISNLSFPIRKSLSKQLIKTLKLRIPDNPPTNHKIKYLHSNLLPIHKLIFMQQINKIIHSKFIIRYRITLRTFYTKINKLLILVYFLFCLPFTFTSFFMLVCIRFFYQPCTILCLWYFLFYY